MGNCRRASIIIKYKYLMDHTILESGLVISYTRSRSRILQLQEKHGVGNVVYSSPIYSCPNYPRPVHRQSEERSSLTRVSIYNLSNDIFYENEVQTVLVEFDCEIDIH